MFISLRWHGLSMQDKNLGREQQDEFDNPGELFAWIVERRHPDRTSR
jgi:hypothetical protein